MPSINVRTDIIEPWVKFLTQETLFPRIPILVLNQNVERPDTDYLGLQLTTPIQRPHFRDDIQPPSSGTIYNIGGQRQFVLSISAYRVENRVELARHDDLYLPQDRLIMIQDALESPVKRQGLTAAGLAVFQVGAILDLTELVETGFESRAQLDITMGIASNRDEDLGAIEKVEVTGTIDGDEDPTVTIE